LSKKEKKEKSREDSPAREGRRKEGRSRVPVAHPCNPSYSGGSGLKPAQANSFLRAYLKKKPFTKSKMGWWNG
jgi:hypothetical protein